MTGFGIIAFTFDITQKNIKTNKDKIGIKYLTTGELKNQNVTKTTNQLNMIKNTLFFNKYTLFEHYCW